MQAFHYKVVLCASFVVVLGSALSSFVVQSSTGKCLVQAL